MDNEQSHHEYTEYIQKKFFKTGLYTHFHIDMVEPESSDGLLVKWTFTFQDLGSTHILTRDPAYVKFDPSTGEIIVDNIPFQGLENAEDAIFQGHYSNYMQDMYRFEGIVM